MSAYTVYVLRSLRTGKYYTGCTFNLEQRLKQHSSNRTRSLRNQSPFEVVYTEKFVSLSEARKRELQIKRYKGGQAFKKLINLGP